MLTIYILSNHNNNNNNNNNNNYNNNNNELTISAVNWHQICKDAAREIPRKTMRNFTHSKDDPLFYIHSLNDHFPDLYFH